ncbi:hypothetical protein OTK51_10535 [Vibrio scophthalmi]|uniref:hypothetical protein n=1 Tax=Vibrio scophthalmi TaxID=45658 RepID=UPI0022843032|nr:hypothetical protein [Vibrio scophthalmi]MCY9803868.1 hypothetical protein [Vibrio scophthalmi]
MEVKLSEVQQTLNHGGCFTDGEIQRIGLSPMPISCGRKPMVVSGFFTKTPDGLVEIRTLNADVHILQLMFFWMLATSAIVVPMWFQFGHALFMYPLLVPMTVFLAGLFYCFFKENHESIGSSPPIRFHPQKKQVLLSWVEHNFKKPERPDTMASDFSVFMFCLALLLIMSGSTMLISALTRTNVATLENHLFWIVPMILGAYPLYYTVKPWFFYFKASKNYVSSVEVFPVDWEDLNIEFQSFTGVNYTGMVSLNNLTFTAPIPNDPNGDSALVSLPVYSQEEALCLYELLCDYMENGAPGIEHTAANKISNYRGDYNRAGYKRLILKRMRKTPLFYPIWRVWNWMSLRYFAHWYLEYQIEVNQQKVLNREDVKAWSALIPEEQWQQLSQPLTEANQKVRKLYAHGIKWEDDKVQKILREYQS